eukprot:gene13937-14054_t
MTCLTVVLACSTLVIAPAEARYRHFRHHVRATGYTPPFAAMVVDANSGRVLYAKNENELRHPASLTKVMTLYLLFEQMEKGRFSLDSMLKVSAHGAAQQPSKLGLDPGDTISVEDSIKAIVTRSANDVAVTIAENVGGDEESFADMMTKKAHQLGMSRTVYRNASGLPNNDQVTTARDLTILGRAIQDRFPKYYHYFSTHSFDYAGATILNHNKLLGRVEGVDGIKTGFTNASGFNLLTSVKRDGHALVASVLGGRSGPERDRIMAGLIEDHIDDGAVRRSVAAISDRPSAEPIKVASGEPVKLGLQATKSNSKALANMEDATDEEDSDVPAAKPAAKSVSIKPVPMVAAALAASEAAKSRPAFISANPKAPVPPELPSSARTAAAKPVPLDGSTKARPLVASSNMPAPAIQAANGSSVNGQPAMRWVQGPAAVPTSQVPTSQAKVILASVQDNMPTASLPLPVARPPAEVTKVAETVASSPAAAHTGWMIQIGAADDQTKATALLTRAKSESKGALASASPFTEKVQKGDQTLYRARFAGLEADEAQTACKRLKQSGFACFPTKN